MMKVPMMVMRNMRTIFSLGFIVILGREGRGGMEGGRSWGCWGLLKGCEFEVEVLGN